MKITSVTVRKVDKENSRMKGIASVLLDDCFVIRDIRIIEGKEGLFIAMPSRKNADGEYHDIAHPINAETRKYIEDVVIEKQQDEEKTTDSEEKAKNNELSKRISTRDHHSAEPQGGDGGKVRCRLWRHPVGRRHAASCQRGLPTRQVGDECRCAGLLRGEDSAHELDGQTERAQSREV